MTAQSLQTLLEAFLSRNNGPGYGVVVTDMADDLTTISATITFVAGRVYCCAEPFCHVPNDPASFVRFVADRGVVLPKTMEMRWKFVIEAGVCLECDSVSGDVIVEKRREYTEVSKTAA